VSLQRDYFGREDGGEEEKRKERKALPAPSLA
jgi:hypothetical protein